MDKYGNINIFCNFKYVIQDALRVVPNNYKILYSIRSQEPDTPKGVPGFCNKKERED